MILAIAVDNSLDPGRVSEIDIEQNEEELTDAGAVIAKCRYRSHMLRTRAVSQKCSELVRCTAKIKTVKRNTRKHIAIVIAAPLLARNPDATVRQGPTKGEPYLCI